MHEFSKQLRILRLNKGFKTEEDLRVRFNYRKLDLTQVEIRNIDVRFIRLIEKNPENITISKFFRYIEFFDLCLVLKNKNRKILLESIKINEQLKSLRIKSKLNISDFSKIAQIPISIICRIEYQQKDLRLKTIVKYITALGYDLRLKSHKYAIDKKII